MKIPEHLPAWVRPLVGTKFLVTVMAMTGAMVALANGWISDDIWMASMNMSAGAFIIGNAFVTHTAIKSGKPPDPTGAAS